MEDQGHYKIFEKRIPFLRKEGHTEMLVELSKESCKAIKKEILDEWWNTQEPKVPGSNYINYGEYAKKAWTAAKKSDAEMKERLTAGEDVQRVSGIVTKRICKRISKRISTNYLVQILSWTL